MSKKDNMPLGVRQEFDDIDYWRELIKSGQTVVDENGNEMPVYDWMKRFMKESYGNGFSRDNPEENILQSVEHKKWAVRNNNNTNRDALNVAKKAGLYVSYDTLDYKQAGKRKEEGWEKTFKTRTEDETLNHILEMSCDDLEIKFTKQSALLLLRIYFRITKFIRMVKKDRKNEK